VGRNKVYLQPPKLGLVKGSVDVFDLEGNKEQRVVNKAAHCDGIFHKVLHNIGWELFWGCCCRFWSGELQLLCEFELIIS